MKTEKEQKQPEFDLSSYRLPTDRQGTARIRKLYSPIPRLSGGVPFDIYDYEMLFHDEKTLKIIREGDTIGCFYIESPGMRSLLRRLSVDTFEMLTAASSVIRPGVAESGMMQEFIARHKDPRRRKYLVPEMEKILGETYGVMIYQEDVIKVAHHIAGLTLEEADLLRRAMSGKLRSHTAMKALQDKFYKSAEAKGYSRSVVAELWRQVESFAGYAFCKAHSASFALLSFQVAFLKTHYPAEFMASVLSNGGGYYSAAVYVQECKRLGLTVLLPCINNSLYEYTGSGTTVRIGLMAIKNLSRAVSQRIVEERAAHGIFVSLDDFIVRVRAGYEDTALLIQCGAMDCLGKTRPTLMRLLDVFMRHRRLLEERVNDLFAFESFRLEKEVETTLDYSITEKCRIEFETFDYMVTRHPLEFFPGWIHSPKIVTADSMNRYGKRIVQMVGWYMASKRIRTKKGDIMKFLSLEDLTGTFEAVIFPKAYEKYAVDTMSMGPFLIEGRVDMENGNNIIVEKLEVLAANELKAALQKDSAEHNYYGDREQVYEQEFDIVSGLDAKKLIRAYAG